MTLKKPFARRRYRRINFATCFVLDLLFLAVCCGASLIFVAPQSLARQSQDAVAVYPNSADGLKRQVEDTLASVKKKDKKTIQLAVNNLMLPDPGSWFSNAFGTENGPKLAEVYSSNRKRLEESLTQQLHNAVKNHQTIAQIKPVQSDSNARSSLANTIVGSLKAPQLLYEVYLSDH